MATQIPTTQIRNSPPRAPVRAPVASKHAIMPPSETPPPVCPPGAVVFDLGDWTKTVPKKGQARVQFSLLRSLQAITVIRLEYKLSSSSTWILQDTLTGLDLRSVSGAYFQMPSAPKRYDLRVTAISGVGCEDPSNRPFSVEVV